MKRTRSIVIPADAGIQESCASYLGSRKNNKTQSSFFIPLIFRPFFKQRQQAFTLLEVIIALALVAILMVAAAPFLKDSLTMNQGDQVVAGITTLVDTTRAAALTSGESKTIDLTGKEFSAIIPKGWKVQVERLSDKKFRPPTSGELWEFNSEGICDPLSLRVTSEVAEPITLKFDPITGQVLHEDL